MDPAFTSALSVLGGSLVGALTSLASTWLTQQQQDRRELLGKRIADRETLYANFIAEASRALVDSQANSLDHFDKLIPLYSLLGRIRLSSSETVVTSAEKVINEIFAEYARPKLPAVKALEKAVSPKGQGRADPLAEFSHVCREELRTLTLSGSFARKRKQPPSQQKVHSPPTSKDVYETVRKET
jgi:hypothetical protein